MEFDEVLVKRRSIRKYKPEPVPREHVVKLLEAARIAPSAGHRQPWHFIVVEDKMAIEKLAGGSKWAAEAPVMIVGLGDPVASPSWYGNDLGVAFEHMVLAATSLGLGTCWMGQTRRDAEVKEILGIPGELKVIALTPLGWPDDSPGPKDRKSLDEIVSWGRYGHKAK
ncbi:MAG: nitroreductase family protein [Candidatus Bathyarchaeota archaeon]|nr:nitroreductase family protein [Candidatus Bathyarchaeota archaeon]